MHYLDKQRAKVNIARELEIRGWTLYGFKSDDSDLMTDYYDPADWSGVAERDGYVVAVAVSSYDVERRSGREQVETRRVEIGDCEHCDGMGQEPGGWTLEAARANPREYHRQTTTGGAVPLFPGVVSPLGFKGGRQKCTRCHGAGKHRIQETVVVATWPEFQPNPPRCTWHVERDGQIIAKGTGLSKCHLTNSHMEPYKSEQEANIEALVNRIERATQGEKTNTAPQVEDISVTQNEEKDGIEIRFPAKPDADTLEQIRAQGFRWHRRGQYWYARRTAERMAFVQGIVAPNGIQTN